MMLYEVAAFDPRSSERHLWIIAAEDECDACGLVPQPERPLRATELATAVSRRHCVIGRLGALMPVERRVSSARSPAAGITRRNRSNADGLRAMSNRISALLRGLVKVRLSVSTASPR